MACNRASIWFLQNNSGCVNCPPVRNWNTIESKRKYYAGIDGINQWDAINAGQDGSRTEFIYNLDDVVPATQGHAGIRMGDYKLLAGYPGAYSGWYPPDEEYDDNIGMEYSDFVKGLKAGNESYFKLYNLIDDPNERHNLAESMPHMVKKLNDRMKEYHAQMIPAKVPPINPMSNPKYFGNVWSPGWCKEPMK